MEVPVELSRIVITETSPQQIIFLKEKNGQRSFPIMIGITEALAIDRRVKGAQMPRPLTHDLLAKVIEAMGGQLVKIVINDLRDGTFIASLLIRHGTEMIEIDARPSDAIALGAAFDTPIFVAEHVMEEVLKESFDIATQRESLEVRRDQLIEQVAELREHLEDKEVQESLTKQDMLALQRQLQEMQADLEAIEELLRRMPG